MFSIFKKKKAIVSDLTWLGVDLHSHLLPGIDDGSPDVESSVAYIRALKALGISKFHCTPHIIADLYPNTPETINAAREILVDALKAAEIDVELTAAAEHMVDESFKVSNDLLCLPNKHILIEMSYLNESPNIEQVVFDLQIAGYTVILAHPERYNFYHESQEKFHRLKDMNVLFQLNLLSVLGYYGREVKRCAEYLLEHQCYDLAATDFHHERHLKVLSDGVNNGVLYEKLGNYPFKNQKLFG
jgi:protein-tyrosine phosphatase